MNVIRYLTGKYSMLDKHIPERFLNTCNISEQFLMFLDFASKHLIVVRSWDVWCKRLTIEKDFMDCAS